MPKFPTDTPDITPALNDRVLVSDTSNGGLAGDVLLSNLPVPTSVQDLLDKKASISGQVFTGSISATNLSGTNTGDNATNATSNAYALTTPDFYKYSIVRTVSGGNLTVALKNYEGNDPTLAKPVKIMIGGVVRTITAGLTTTQNIGTNNMNLGSAELATKEVDLFLYAAFDSTSGTIKTLFSRIPSANTKADFTWSFTAEKGVGGDTGSYIATDPVVNIGRFNAILSGGAGYTWSIPATSVVINSPIRESDWKDAELRVYGSAGSMGAYTESHTYKKYKISGDTITVKHFARVTNLGSWTGDLLTSLPFGAKTSVGFQQNSGRIQAQGGITTKAILNLIETTGVTRWANDFAIQPLAYSSLSTNDWIAIETSYQI